MIAIAAVALLLPSLAASAGAQTLDCQQPKSDIDRAICRNADLMTARGALGVAYEGLFHSLTGAARDHLVADQERWLRNNQTLCVASIRRITTARVDTQTAACLTERMAARTGRLLATPAGRDYPFVSEHLLVDFGLAARSAYRLFFSYPQFDLPGTDNRAVNQDVVRSARERMDVKPLPRAGDDFPGPWLLEGRHDLRFPVRGLVSVISSIYSQLDGARPMNVSVGRLVDVTSGKALDIDDILNDGWPRRVAALCLEEMRRQPGDVPPEARIAEMLAEPDRWMFGRDNVEIVFRYYEEGSAPTGPRLIAIPYTRLKGIIRRDGPLADKAR